ncbi:MAG: hypothetical protein JW725_00425 [Candidatus Babeliaceae bacterium]|nr:hypothetical protein [Candidatus Babeliaceae bacterium]
MNSAVRRKLGKNIYRYVLWFTLFGLVGSYFLFIPKRWASVPENAIASVNGEAINIGDYKRRVQDVQRTVQDVRRQYGPIADFVLMQIGIAGDPLVVARDQLVVEALLTQGASDLGIYTVSPDYILEKLGDRLFVMHYLGDIIPLVFVRSGGIDRAALSKYLRNIGVSSTVFHDHLENAFKRAMVHKVLATAAYVPQAELNKERMANQGKRNLVIISLDLGAYREKMRKAGIKDEEARAFFAEENKKTKRYWSEEKRQGVVWTFPLKNVEVSASDEEIRRAFVNKRKELGKMTFEEAKPKLEEELKREFARRRFELNTKSIASKSPESDSLLKDMISQYRAKSKPVAKDNKEAWRVLYSIPTVGQRTSFVSGDVGYVVQLDKLEPRICSEFEKVRNVVMDDLCTARARREIEKDLEQILTRSRSGGKGFIEEVRVLPGVRVTEYKDVVHGDETWKKFEHLPVARMRLLIHPGFGITHLNDKGGEFIYLKAIELPKEGLEVEKNERIHEDLSKLAKALIESSFLEYLQRTAKIIYRETSGQRPVGRVPLPISEDV